MKEAYYFSHDSNARHDPKISALRSLYGAEGYGWYWIFIEMMREADGFKLDILSKYIWNAYAVQTQSNAEKMQKFVCDCIEEFNLFKTDGEYFWSDSLMRRMDRKEEISNKRKKAAQKRWGKQKNDANAMQMDSNSNAKSTDAMQTDAKERKVNEIKVNEIKEKDLEVVEEKPNPFTFWEQNGFGTISSYLSEKISYWLDGDFFEESEEIVIQAMKEAVLNNVRKWNYVESTLTNWKSANLRTVREIEAHMSAYKAMKGGSNNAPLGGRSPSYTTKDSGEPKEIFVPNPTGWKRPQRNV